MQLKQIVTFVIECSSYVDLCFDFNAWHWPPIDLKPVNNCGVVDAEDVQPVIVLYNDPGARGTLDHILFLIITMPRTPGARDALGHILFLIITMPRTPWARGILWATY